ncbi:MAG: YIP1 family protein [Calditrichaeota bacterium]|nr:YIP1 family protein [Calditrichota bacterium]
MSRPSRNPAVILNLFFYPRQTIRLLLEKSDPPVELGLVVLFGLGSVELGGEQQPLATALAGLGPVFSLVSAVIFGLLYLYTYGLVYALVGGAFGGDALPQHTRTAVAWSQVPPLIAMLILLPMWAMGVSELSLQPVALLSTILMLYSFFLGVMFLAEAHGFSMFKALLTLLISSVVLWLLQVFLAGVLNTFL